MAKIDYDVGDLIEVVREPVCGVLKPGDVFVCLEIIPNGRCYRTGRRSPAAKINRVGPSGTGFWAAELFRKLPKKSQEFFAGEMQTVRDLVPAE